MKLPLSPIDLGGSPPRTPQRRQRALSESTGECADITLPADIHPGYSSDFIGSSPVRGTAAEQKAIKNKKRQKKRKATMAAETIARRERHNYREQQLRHEAEAQHPSPPLLAEPESPRTSAPQIFQHIMDELELAGLSWGSFVEWVSNPDSSCDAGNRYEGFFREQDQVLRVLNHWVSWRNCNSGRQLVRRWALDHVRKRASEEGRAVTKDGLLQSRTMVIDKLFVHPWVKV
ncbi:hypothetical protein BC629DRAFT_1588473 [Irpex lacteus]|nr:hypothetical protein BC629DRAFT_1588473 [Irpex lacteus]